MKALLSRKKIIVVSLVVMINLMAVSALAKEEEVKYEKDGMTFVVGKHEPDKRVNEKQKEIPKTKEIIIHKQIITNATEGQEEESANTEEIVKDNVNQEEKNIFAQWSDGLWKVTKDVVLGAAAIFENTVNFLERVTFMDRVIFADKDMAGEAIVKKGEKEVEVEFKNPFIFPPAVNITAENFFQNFSLKQVTEKGFTIAIEKETESPVKFKWTALAVVDPKKEKNK